MSIQDNVVKDMTDIANDNSHGYKWGGNGPIDFDCSGLINYVWQKNGIPVNSEVRNTTKTMKTYYCKHGFSDVTKSVNLKTGAGLQPADVLVNQQNHTAMYVGAGKIVQARSDIDGKSGDSGGQEIRVQSYYNYPWDLVLRYTGGTQQAKPTQSQPQTSVEVPVNPIQNPAQVQNKENLSCSIGLPLLKLGSKNGYVFSAQVLLIANGYPCGGKIVNGAEKADGDFGRKTKSSVVSWQKAHGLSSDGEIGKDTWASLLKG